MDVDDFKIFKNRNSNTKYIIHVGEYTVYVKGEVLVTKGTGTVFESKPDPAVDNG